jgi:hypothetical protein
VACHRWRHPRHRRPGKVEVSSHCITRGERIEVASTLHTGDNPLKGGLTVLFSDGEPTEGSAAFDLERIGHLRADDTYDVRVPFRSSACWFHRLVVAAGPGTAFEQRRHAHVWVECGNR